MHMQYVYGTFPLNFCWFVVDVYLSTQQIRVDVRRQDNPIKSISISELGEKKPSPTAVGLDRWGLTFQNRSDITDMSQKYSKFCLCFSTVAKSK